MSKFMNVKTWGYQFWTVLTGCAHLQNHWSGGLGAKPPEWKPFCFWTSQCSILQCSLIFLEIIIWSILKHELFFADDEFAEGGRPPGLPSWRWRCADVKVYERKNLRLSVLDDINGLRSFAEPLVRGYWSEGLGAKPPRSWKPFCFWTSHSAVFCNVH